MASGFVDCPRSHRIPCGQARLPQFWVPRGRQRRQELGGQRRPTAWPLFHPLLATRPCTPPTEVIYEGRIDTKDPPAGRFGNTDPPFSALLFERNLVQSQVK